MSEHQATIQWCRGEQVFTDRSYSRAHQWQFDGGLTVPASSSPQVVKPPFSDPGALDPEEAFVAALSSCHMLWFLDIAAARGLCVDSYTDRAVGVLERDGDGALAITRVTLFPDVVFSGPLLPTSAEYDALHHKAHASCFIARSVKTTVLCKPLYRTSEAAA